MKFIENGITRKVFLIWKYAIKVPQTDYGWKYFLKGLLANMSEVKSFKLDKENMLCPILFYVPGGWLVVMPKTKVLTDKEFIDYRVFIEEFDCRIEYKSDSFGWHKGVIVAIDYGEFYKTPAI